MCVHFFCGIDESWYSTHFCVLFLGENFFLKGRNCFLRESWSTIGVIAREVNKKGIKNDAFDLGVIYMENHIRSTRRNHVVIYHYVIVCN
jgi:hypothetical protein